MEALTAKLGTSEFISAADSKDFALKRRDYIESGSRFSSQSLPGVLAPHQARENSL